MKTRIITSAVLAILIVALSAIVTQCYAQTTTTSSTRCFRLAGMGTQCVNTTTSGVSSSKSWQNMTREEKDRSLADEQDKDARIAQWEEFCKPTYTTDAYGMKRASYAHANCDLGRSQ